jgi:UDP-glucose 4-epimerase
MAQLVRAIRAGWLLPLASITSRRAFLGIENLTSFIRHRLERRHDSASPLIVADDEQVSASEFATLLAAALGRRARQFPFPPALLARLGFERLVAPLEVDTTRSRSDGWTPPFSLAEGLRRSFAADR